MSGDDGDIYHRRPQAPHCPRVFASAGPTAGQPVSNDDGKTRRACVTRICVSLAPWQE